MKIAFVSTRGIPNNYGGFEEFAEKVGTRLVGRGHDVIVYNPSFHPFAEDRFEGVRIKRKFSPENMIGTSANFIYDFLSIWDAAHRERSKPFTIGIQLPICMRKYSMKLSPTHNRP